jgi:hypothetical protein
MNPMSLFEADPQINLLPSDGLVRYFGKIIDQQLSDGFYHYLLNKIDWKQDEAIIFGKHLYTKRKAAWYGDKSYAYMYSKTTKVALPWTAELLGNYSGNNKIGLFLSSFLQKSGKNTPLLRTVQAAKNIKLLTCTTDFIRRKK